MIQTVGSIGIAISVERVIRNRKMNDVGMPVTASMRKQERKKKNGGRPVVLR